MNVLTIDVEDYFQVHGFESVISRSTWDQYPVRVVENTHRVLDILADCDVRATFFVLGWVADSYPDLVREIASSGHEIAAHGYWHERIYRQTPQEFEADLRKSLEAIQRSSPSPILGYRAPAFSIIRDSLWALEILKKNGMRYDSSIFPLALHDRYGIPDAQRFAHFTDAGIWEFPVSTIRFGRWNFPVAGGGYFRLYPLWITRWAIRQLNSQGQPAVVYLHPWEFDTDQPRINQAPLLSQFRHYVNLGSTEKRLRILLKEHKFGPIRDIFAQQLDSKVGAA